jgi:hypothetical protein
MAKSKSAAEKDPTTKVLKQLQNRIVGMGEESPEKILAHPLNYRTHSAAQESALEGLLEEVGWVSNVIVNKKSGRLLDGHLRVALAKKRHEKKVPVVYVSLSDAQEKLVLATLDPLGDLAGIDPKRFNDLLSGIDPETLPMQKLIADLEEEIGLGKEQHEAAEVLLDQAIQLEPGKEFVVIMADSEDEFTELKKRLALKQVRRGGYKKGSAFDAVATERVVKAARLLKLLGRK